MKKIILPNKNFIAETVILANGEFPTGEIALSILANAQFLVCCDGAANQLLLNSTRLPDAIVGDCDSVTEENKKIFSGIIHRIPDQETNDLTKAVNFCLSIGRKRITILGATGKREDHTLANISLLGQYFEKDTEFQMITDYGVFNAISENSEFESFEGQQVSLFNISATAITSHNLRYPLQNRILHQLWEGTLNESMGNSFRLDVEGKYIVFREIF